MFREFEPQEYYRRHFKQNRREDGRALQQSRKLFLTLSSFSDCEGSCLLRRGGCIIIVQVKAIAQELPINPLTNSYTNPLVSIELSDTVIEATVSERRHTTHLDRLRLESYLSQSIEDSLKHLNVEAELVRKEGHKSYGHVLNIALKVLSEDGTVLENCLLCTQFALCSTRLP